MLPALINVGKHGFGTPSDPDPTHFLFYNCCRLCLPPPSLLSLHSLATKGLFGTAQFLFSLILRRHNSIQFANIIFSPRTSNMRLEDCCILLLIILYTVTFHEDNGKLFACVGRLL